MKIEDTLPVTDACRESSPVADEPGSSFSGETAFSAARRQDGGGGGLRGLFWAVLLEGAALSLLIFLIYEWHALHL